MIAKLFAVRLGGEGIGSYEIRPGLIETPMTAPSADLYRKRIADGLDGRSAHGPAVRYRFDGRRACDGSARLLHWTGPAGRWRLWSFHVSDDRSAWHVPCHILAWRIRSRRALHDAGCADRSSERAAQVQSRRFLRRPCGRQSFREHGTFARPRDRLVKDSGFPASSARSGPRHRGSNGYGAAGRRTGLDRRAGIDPRVFAGGVSSGARPHLLGRWNRSARAGRRQDARRRRAGLHGTDRGGAGARRPAHFHGESGARAHRFECGGLSGRLSSRAGPVRQAGDPALAGRHVRSGAQRLLGR